jgi:hypothetical protein
VLHYNNSGTISLFNERREWKLSADEPVLNNTFPLRAYQK